MKLRALEISEVNSYIKRVLTNDAILYNLKVKGEISNFKVHGSGNVYLSLKDEKSKINCVIFKSNYNKDLQVDNGSKVIAHGYISLYERDGSYQLYINDIEIEGLGDLYIEFNKLKEQLSKEGLFDVVKSSIAGAVIGNILLVVGASMLAGGLKYKTQKFNQKVSEVSSSMLLFAVLGLCIPALFTHTVDPKLLNTRYEGLSIFVAVVMIVIYALSLFFSFSTHKHIYNNNDEHEGNAKWSLKKAISILVISTILIAIESEFLVNGIEPITESLGWSQFFVGIILIPIIGNAAEHSTAVIMARKDKMDVALEIAVGSSLQIILFVAPVLIFLSLFFTPMSIVFNPFELIALIASVLIANRVSHDGESNWLEGVQLLAVYLIIAASFFIL